MSDGSHDPPGVQVFGPKGDCTAPFPCDPGEPERAPPRTSDAARADSAARALDALRPLIRSELRRRGVPERDVSDLVQTVLIDVLPWWTAEWLAPAPRPRGELAAYVRASARHAASQYRRKRSRCPEILQCEQHELEQDLTLNVPILAPSAEEALLGAHAKRQRADILSPESLREILGRSLWHIFREYAVLQLPVKWIADGNRAPVTTIYNRIRIASDILRAELRRRRIALGDR